MRSIQIDRVYNFSRSMVWEAITNSDALAEWLMPNDFRPVLSHEFTFRTTPAPGFDGIVHSKVLEILPPERLVLAWKGGALDTTVVFELTEINSSQTRLRLIHDGFRGASNILPRLILGSGWRKLLAHKLPDYVERKNTK